MSRRRVHNTLPSNDTHAFGTVLPAGVSIAEAIEAAGLGWGVELAPMGAVVATDTSPLRLRLAAAGLAETEIDEIVGLVPPRTVSTVGTSRAVRRSDTGAILGTVGPSYRPISNADAFAWVQPLVESGLVRLAAAGSTRAGSRVWIRADVLGADGAPVQVGGDDTDLVLPSLLFAHGHDGSMAVRVGISATRMLCSNALAATISTSPDLATVRHTAGAGATLAALRDVIAAGIRGFRATAETWGVLADRPCTDTAFERYVRTVFRLDATDGARLLPRLVEAYEGAPGARPGTWWGAYNAVTYYLTHMRGSAATRADSVLFGDSRALAATALSLALEASVWTDETGLVSIPGVGFASDDNDDTEGDYGEAVATFAGVPGLALSEEVETETSEDEDEAGVLVLEEGDEGDEDLVGCGFTIPEGEEGDEGEE